MAPPNFAPLECGLRNAQYVKLLPNITTASTCKGYEFIKCWGFHHLSSGSLSGLACFKMMTHFNLKPPIWPVTGGCNSTSPSQDKDLQVWKSQSLWVIKYSVYKMLWMQLFWFTEKEFPKLWVSSCTPLLMQVKKFACISRSKWINTKYIWYRKY